MTKSALIKLLESYPDDIEIWQDDGFGPIPIQLIFEKTSIFLLGGVDNFWDFNKYGKVLDRKEVLIIGL